MARTKQYYTSRSQRTTRSGSGAAHRSRLGARGLRSLAPPCRGRLVADSLSGQKRRGLAVRPLLMLRIPLAVTIYAAGAGAHSFGLIDSGLGILAATAPSGLALALARFDAFAWVLEAGALRLLACLNPVSGGVAGRARIRRQIAALAVKTLRDAGHLLPFLGPHSGCNVPAAGPVP